jgi:spermidine/putrescine transport system permease protein
MVVLSRLQDFDDSLIEAARDLGATAWSATTRVLLPLLAPGIAAGALLAFTLSIDDFVITFFVAGPGATTLPIRIYSMIKHGSPPLINALSTLLLLVTFATVWLSQRLLEDRE